MAVFGPRHFCPRELVSNGCDAITKLKKLDDAWGEYTLSGRIYKAQDSGDRESGKKKL